MNRVYAENVIEKIVSAERSAAEIMMHAHDIIAESKSGQRDIVTEYDKRVQEYLMQVLSESVPEARFFCEEQKEHDDLHARHLFIIDPIDGTMNFARGFNHSCISVAYMSAGELRAAAVYNPYVDEMFTAVKGEGAYLNGRRLHVSDAPLSDSVVCYGTSPYSTELADETFRLARIAFNAGLDLRREGSAELDLCSVAAGRAGLYFEMQVSLWDYAAGALLVNAHQTKADKVHKNKINHSCIHKFCIRSCPLVKPRKSPRQAGAKSESDILAGYHTAAHQRTL